MATFRNDDNNFFSIQNVFPFLIFFLFHARCNFHYILYSIILVMAPQKKTLNTIIFE